MKIKTKTPKWVTVFKLHTLTHADRGDIRRWMEIAEVPSKKDGERTLYEMRKALAVIRSHRRPEEAKTLWEELGRVKLRKAIVVRKLKQFGARGTIHPQFIPVDQFRKGGRMAALRLSAPGICDWLRGWVPEIRKGGQDDPLLIEIGEKFLAGFERHAEAWAQAKANDALDLEYEKFEVQDISKSKAPGFLETIQQKLGGLAVQKLLTLHAELEDKERKLYEITGGDLVSLKSVDAQAEPMALAYFNEHFAKPVAALGYKKLALGGVYNPEAGQFDLLDRCRKEFAEDFIMHLAQFMVRNQELAIEDKNQRTEKDESEQLEND